MDKGKAELDFSIVLGSAIHDMKNSISMLLDGLEGISENCSGECQANTSVDKLRYEGKRLNNGLVQVLTLYRINNASYTLNLAENDVEEVLEECKMDNEDLLALKGIEIELDYDEDLMCFFDRELISGVINSVLNNAYKYTKDKIRITAFEKDGYLAIAIEDNGPGYPDFMLQGATDRQREISFKRDSTGLGIFFAHTIVNMHANRDKHGFVTIANDGIDGGGRFVINLPV